mmetsp:Transcript_55674/g.147019  ORF Transcript_55674/g.147019 Transcript_55674/m.147019 type:complete len:138 (+) Transcript_55674:598-1011(+)
MNDLPESLPKLLRPNNIWEIQNFRIGMLNNPVCSNGLLCFRWVPLGTPMASREGSRRGLLLPSNSRSNGNTRQWSQFSHLGLVTAIAMIGFNGRVLSTPCSARIGVRRNPSRQDGSEWIRRDSWIIHSCVSAAKLRL